MSKSNQATELFRFVCARPAEKDTRSIRIRRRGLEAESRLQESALSEGRPRSSSFAVASRSLTYTKKITALNDRLGLDDTKLDIGRNIELETALVRKSINNVFTGENLANLVKSEEWKRDEDVLDRALYQFWENGSDPGSLGPQIARQRQLYDLVVQAADPGVGKEDHDSFMLKGFEMGGLPTLTRGGASRERSQRQELRTLRVEATAASKAETRIRNLIEGLRMLNSSAVLQYRVLDKTQPFQYLIMATWVDLLAEEAKKAVKEAGAGSADSNSKSSIIFYYNAIMVAIKTAAVEANGAPKFRSGLFSIGPFNLEMVKPWTMGSGTSFDEHSTDATPSQDTPSKIKPTGVGDLLIVRDHVYKYVGGEIGAIQNVLRSEWLVRETKRLDRTEIVEFSSNELQTEKTQEESTAQRFALSKEANNIIKQDSSMKMGVSTTAYGPYVSVKGDLSYAENSSSESSNKVASQYSQDITSRASSKIIEKTFNSLSKTTISEFQDNNRHEFKNTDGANISGVYQWVNKISQCQMYNYGKRLLIDITIPEPAAFLMTQSSDSGPVLENPLPLTESASDLHEGNYSAIAARYQATGIKPPGDLVVSFSKSFKADMTSADAPKPGSGNAFHFGGTANVALDLDIPAGYLAYAAKIQVGVRTGPSITAWHVNEERGNKEWFGYEGAPREPETYVSVAGRIIPPGGVTSGEVSSSAGGLFGGSSDRSLAWDTVGTVFFTEPLLSGKVAVAVSQDFCLALSGSIYVCCVREPVAYAKWQQETYEGILTAYTKQKMDYERARAETAISTLNVATGNNPLENTGIINTELKKTAIAFMTAQNFKLFGSVEKDAQDGIPQVTEFDKALEQGAYADFFEKAFEWENMTYALYPYFWAARDTWRERMGFHSPDPTFTAFIKAGMARVTVPAKLGFGLEVVHFLDSGRIWQKGPVSTLASSEYYSVAQEIMAAEAKVEEVRVSEPWYTVVPTDLVRLRADGELPRFRVDGKGVWVERGPGEDEDEDEE
ncbi:hypothetical protein EJ04DRAFT_602997 [Polyplosphaeria fusca]|uniref:MACPF domain-containing protein n=1 Tax=Polyplosphaeria fusca TaxID=682080 RepID=A0A9P4QXE9_9PLEO|nr:hypothetical protein EJ04DRAFT_602997 [Polyplosphaeria fusca]